MHKIYMIILICMIQQMILLKNKKINDYLYSKDYDDRDIGIQKKSSKFQVLDFKDYNSIIVTHYAIGRANKLCVKGKLTF